MALQILRPYGLIQLPIDNHYLSGAIFVRDGKRIPLINTALPRANQYFTAWHEIYHLLFDEVSFDHLIESEILMEERKAEYFAALMLLGNLACAVIAICMGADQSLMPRKISLCVFQPDGLCTFSC